MHELFKIVLEIISKNQATERVQMQQLLDSDYLNYLLKLSAKLRISADSKVGMEVISLENKANKKHKV